MLESVLVQLKERDCLMQRCEGRFPRMEAKNTERILNCVFLIVSQCKMSICYRKAEQEGNDSESAGGHDFSRRPDSLEV